MPTANLFAPEIRKWDIPYTTLWYCERWIAAEVASTMMATILDEVPFRQDSITLFGKPVMQPREVCWMADAGLNIKYSGLVMEPKPWHPLILELRHRLEAEAGLTFNSVLLNHYRDGADSMGWHADDEPELGPDPVIASVSLGAERPFQLKMKTGGNLISYTLHHGSLFIMETGCQRYYKHQLPKRKSVSGPRLNMTFRNMIKSA